MGRALVMAIVLGGAVCSWAPVGWSQSLTAYNFEVLHDNPRFYWNFNEASGNAIDLVRKQVNDELASFGGATRGASLSTNLGSTALFNGANAFAASSMADYEMPSAWAIEMWAKADGSLAGLRQDYLLNSGGGLNSGGNNPGVIFDFTTDNSIGLFSGAGRTDNVAGAPLINDNGWHHYVFTFYGNGSFGVADRVDVAVDGVVSTIPRGGFSAGFNLQNALVVGAAFANGTNAFQGQIDEVAFYDLGNLTQAQVAARTQDIADHYALGSASEKTDLFIVDPSQITYNYTAGVQPNPNNNRDDNSAGTLGGGKLIDGVIASTNTGANLSDGSTVGYDDPAGFNNDNGQPHPGIVFDLGEKLRLEEIWIDYIGAASAAGVAAPDRVDVAFSDDGVTFGGLMSFTDFNDSAHSTLGTGNFWSRRLVADVGGVNAEFVRLNFFNNQQWTFLSEVQFVASVPEPGSFVLWSVIGVGLFGFALRHRWWK